MAGRGVTRTPAANTLLLRFPQRTITACAAWIVTLFGIVWTHFIAYISLVDE
jgi:hypothetical protein